MGSKADGLNLSEIMSNAPGSTGGGQPKPIRKRGYHRALKSCKQWVVSQARFEELTNSVLKNLYGDMAQSLLSPNPLFNMQGLGSWLPSTPYKVEVESGIYFGLDRTTAPIRFQIPPKISLWSRIKSLFSF